MNYLFIKSINIFYSLIKFNNLVYICTVVKTENVSLLLQLNVQYQRLERFRFYNDNECVMISFTCLTVLFI